MAVEQSIMLPLGTIAPGFNLLDVVSDQKMTFGQVRGRRGTVVIFSCNHCPFVLHVQEEIVEFAKECIPTGIGVVAINSNDPEKYPADSPDLMRVFAEKYQFPFPYLFDESQQVAKDYQAVCTPDFFLFNHEMKCVYRGRFDESTPGNGIKATGHDLRTAIGAMLDIGGILRDQKPSIGCSIKWKSDS